MGISIFAGGVLPLGAASGAIAAVAVAGSAASASAVLYSWTASSTCRSASRSTPSAVSGTLATSSRNFACSCAAAMAACSLVSGQPAPAARRCSEGSSGARTLAWYAA